MTTAEIIDYYKALLIMQYADKPKAKATVDVYVTEVVQNQFPLQVQDAFNLDTAIGVQLDTLGKYIGVKRSANIDPTTYVSLSDSDYRQLIKFAIIVNYSGSSLYDIQYLLYTFFNDGVLVFDNSNMHMNYFLDSAIGSLNLVLMIITLGLLPRPMGVQLASVIYGTGIGHLFSYRTYLLPTNPTATNPNTSGMNTYSSYSYTSPWLNYSYAL